MAQVVPLFDQILLEKVERKEEKTASGIYIPQETASEEAPAVGKIVAFGEGKAVTKAIEKYGLKEGMLVIYSKYSGTEVKLGGQEYVLISVKDLLAILKE